MFSALLSFLGGSVFRMVWGEISSYLTARQEHRQQLEMMKLQNDLEASRADRELARLKMQSELGVKEVQVAGDLAIQKSEADAFLEAMKSSMKPIGIYFVDAWNGVIRPSAATFVLLLWFTKVVVQGFVMDDWDRDISGVVLGFYFADRSLKSRSK